LEQTCSYAHSKTDINTLKIIVREQKSMQPVILFTGRNLVQLDVPTRVVLQSKFGLAPKGSFLKEAMRQLVPTESLHLAYVCI
jgi:hypothetical protein